MKVFITETLVEEDILALEKEKINSDNPCFILSVEMVIILD
jgi:hypothetical protein